MSFEFITSLYSYLLLAVFFPLNSLMYLHSRVKWMSVSSCQWHKNVVSVVVHIYFFNFILMTLKVVYIEGIFSLKTFNVFFFGFTELEICSL